MSDAHAVVAHQDDHVRQALQARSHDGMPLTADMPPRSYLARSLLAAELMISESIMHDFVRENLLPSPIKRAPQRLIERLSPQNRAAEVIGTLRRRSTGDQSADAGVAQVVAD